MTFPMFSHFYLNSQLMHRPILLSTKYLHPGYGVLQNFKKLHNLRPTLMATNINFLVMEFCKNFQNCKFFLSPKIQITITNVHIHVLEAVYFQFFSHHGNTLYLAKQIGGFNRKIKMSSSTAGHENDANTSINKDSKKAKSKKRIVNNLVHSLLYFEWT
jgi:hypothetical protein